MKTLFTLNFTAITLTAALLISLLSVPIAAQQNSAQQSYPNYRVAGFVQQHFTLDETDGRPANFSIYRARIGVSGQIHDRIRVNLVGGYVEPPNRTPRLVNAFVDFDVHPLLQIRTGQFLVPFGLEGPEVITFNPAIERSTAIRRLNTFNMFRDIGIQFSGRHEAFTYAIAVVNGTGANNPEQVDPKDILMRVGYDILPDLNVGFSGHYGRYQPDATSSNTEARYRIAADFFYRGTPFFTRGEFIYSIDELPGGGDITRFGTYLLAGYKITEQLEAILRGEYFEPNTDIDDAVLTIFTIGANYRFVGNTRVSANYEIRDDKLNPDIKNLFTVQMQIAF